MYIARAHVTTNLKFGSCTALSSSSPVIEASKLVTVEVESHHLTIEAPASMWLIHCACTILTTFYQMHH